jgi:hypothetical protein
MVQFSLRHTHILKLNYLLISATLGANSNKKKIILRFVSYYCGGFFNKTELIVLIIFQEYYAIQS